MSESERPDRLRPSHQVTAEDIRALAGPSTPHFALQTRNRIKRLIEPLPADHPARREGERQIARLEELAQHSGEPRGPGPGWSDHEIEPEESEAETETKEAR